MSKQTLIRTFDFLAEPTARTNSFVGTEEYLAPEIIIGARCLVPGLVRSSWVCGVWCLGLVPGQGHICLAPQQVTRVQLVRQGGMRGFRKHCRFAAWSVHACLLHDPGLEGLGSGAHAQLSSCAWRALCRSCAPNWRQAAMVL